MDVADTALHGLPAEDALHRLGSTRHGLSVGERSARFTRHGPNDLETARPDPRWLTLVRQFGSPMIVFLLVAAVVTAFMREWIDTGAILLALVLNAVIGYWQERKALRDVQALRSLSSPTARVLQDGHALQVDAVTLVPGDVVLLESGDRVPADLRLLEASGLRVDESMLTGEVLAVDKSTTPVDADTPLAERSSMAFSGTLVVAGRAVGLTTATGRHSELGEINELVQTTDTRTPLQVLTHRMEKIIAAVILGVAAAMFLVGLGLGYEPNELFRTAVALIVSAMPEALPIVLTVAMGVGVSRMAAHHAVVRHLPSVETLGSTTVIGSDKTGTLTQNRLTVERIWTADGDRDLTGEGVIERAAGDLSGLERAVARAGALTNEARVKDPSTGELHGDAVDVAMASFALRTGVVGTADLAITPERHMPYEPHHQFSQSVVTGPDGARTLYVKGAPEKVLEFCDRWATASGPQPLDAAAADTVNAASVRMGAEGLRVLATASRPVPDGEDLPEELPRPRGLDLLGLEGMADPPRPGVPESVTACQDAGIRVMMITGDHPVTASSIGRRLGLDVGSGAAPLTGREVDELGDDELRERLRTTSVAARMTPQNKLRIVELLREEGETVAVTGDGVNDAPALKAASIGVAMGRSGTDVARESADLVLTDDNFVTIVQAVEQGRVTFAAIRKASFFLLANATGFMLAVAVNLFTDHPLIFLPVMLLWTNIVTNGVQDIALAFEKGEGDELRQEPRDRTEGVLNGTMWVRTVLTGVWMAAGTLLVYSHAIDTGYAVDHARTYALTTMVMFNFFNVMNARTERRSLFQVNVVGNPLLVISAIVALLMHWGVMSWGASAGVLGLAPLTGLEWGTCILFGSTVLVLVEVEKLIRRRLATAGRDV
ncbi:MAG TPA: HAD-IC family P-type ATPase [Citricoccus sp.]